MLPYLRNPKKIQLDSINRDEEPNFYAFSEWLNAKIDEGLTGIHLSSKWGDDAVFARLQGKEIPPSPWKNRDEWAASILAFVTAPSVPIEEDL